ncbi:MAG: rod shape-determining protein MreC [Acidimicrobiales bacterium]
MALQPARGARARFVLALVVVSALTLVTLDLRQVAAVQTARSWLLTALDPVGGALAGALAPVTDTARGAFRYDDVRDENRRLRDRVAELESAQVQQTNAQQLLEEVLAQNRIPTPAAAPKVLARVVSGPVSSFENTIKLDKGADDGVEAEMVVVTGAGLVGRVVDVTPNRSVVALADSRDFGIGVRVVGSQLTLVARGQGRGQPLLIQGEVDRAAGLVNGDGVVTSGLDRSLFPPDIPVGVVEGVTDTPAGKAQVRVEVRLAAAFDELSFVSVLLWKPPA